MPDFISHGGGDPEETMPNFEALKMSYFCMFGPFLGPNGPFRLFSHYILYPTGTMKEKNDRPGDDCTLRSV